MHFQNLV